jgi:hypothetical protein
MTEEKKQTNNEEECFKEFVELIIPNVFEMKLGSNNLSVDKLAEIIMNCFALSKSPDLNEKGRGYCG